MLTWNWKLKTKRIFFFSTFYLISLFLVQSLPAQTSNLSVLKQRLQEKNVSQKGSLYHELKSTTDGPMGALNQDPNSELMGIDRFGFPIFYKALNLNSAYTTRTNELWPLGDTDLDLTGVTTLQSQFGLWDRAGVRLTHVEFESRAVQIDDPSSISGHSTHTAGTMICAGQNIYAKGMAPSSPLSCYDWTDDFVEVIEAAQNGMLISNHSYGEYVGWSYNMSEGDWYWFGDPSVSEVEDYNFGYYSDIAHDVDDIAYNAPYLLMCWAGGNDRLEGPTFAVGHWVWDDDRWVWSEVERNVDGNDYGYDTMSHMALAKNILSVEATATIPEGYEDPGDVRTTSFSSKGPTDDGRIKPDLVVPGLNINSTGSDSDTDYQNGSGSSTASPAVAGIANLMQEYFRRTHAGENMKASTLRALLINSTEEAGNNDGPDYTFGYGLLNSVKAVDIITKDIENNGRIFERILHNQTSDSIFFNYDGRESIRLTIAWNDPPSEVADPVLNDPTPVLVNDLDVRLIRLSSNEVYEPWVLNPSNVYEAASTGDNHVDNVEQISVLDPEPGPFCVVVTHKGTLENDAQDYGLAVSGMDFLQDKYFPRPKFLSDDIIYWTGQINLSWMHDGETPDNMDLMVYDDGSPETQTNVVGNLHANHFSVSGPCEILEIQLYTISSMMDREFLVQLYRWEENHPGFYNLDNVLIQHANMNGWNILSYEDEPFPVTDDFLVGFKTEDFSISLGKDFQNSGESWIFGGTSWTEGDGTLFIRTLVRYPDGSTDLIGSDGPQLDELDEFQHFRIWKNGEPIDTCSTLTFSDVLTTEGTYEYWLDAIFSEGRSVRSNPLVIEWEGVSVDEQNDNLPETFAVSRAWPNPFNPELTFDVSLPSNEDISITVYDINGRFVGEIYNGELLAGIHQFGWKPEKIAAGTYFLNVSNRKNIRDVQKVVFLK